MRTARNARLGRVVAMVALISAVAAPSALAAPSAGSARSCGPAWIDLRLSPPDGMVGVVDVVMSSRCTLVVRSIRYVQPTSLTASDQALVLSTIGSTTSGTNTRLATLAVTTKWAYALGRTFDPVGLLLNEYWTENQWSYDGTKITQWFGQDGDVVHKEADGRGWSHNLNDHTLKLTAGGIGGVSETIKGHLGFSYVGVFDGSGADYYNAYWNTMTGFRDGSKSCLTTYTWKKSFPGWRYQGLCGFGHHP